jgi:hypothetical protein
MLHLHIALRHGTTLSHSSTPQCIAITKPNRSTFTIPMPYVTQPHFTATLRHRTWPYQRLAKHYCTKPRFTVTLHYRTQPRFTNAFHNIAVHYYGSTLLCITQPLTKLYLMMHCCTLPLLGKAQPTLPIQYHRKTHRNLTIPQQYVTLLSSTLAKHYTAKHNFTSAVHYHTLPNFTIAFLHIAEHRLTTT